MGPYITPKRKYIPEISTNGEIITFDEAFMISWVYMEYSELIWANIAFIILLFGPF